MQGYTKINSIKEISSNYNTYIIDLCGVLHNGVSIYPKANAALRHLIANDKQVVLLSNSPRKSGKVAQKLKDLGVDLSGTTVITSGDLFLQDLHANYRGKKIYILDGSNSKDIVEEAAPYSVDTMEDASFLLNLSVTDDHTKINRHDDKLKEALSNKLVMLCPNPDKIAPHGDGYHYPGGAIAKVYEDMGGRVIYYGKPYISAYKEAIPDFANIDKSKLLVIGDNLETDIVGAYNIGCDSLLIKNGAYRELESLTPKIQASGVEPTYLIEYFQV